MMTHEFIPGTLRRNSCILPLFGALMAASLTGSPPCLAATTPVIGANLNLSRLTGNQYEASVAINPANGQDVFVAARNELGGLSTAISHDGGVTWKTALIGQSSIPQPGDIPRAYGNVTVAWDSFGHLLMAYLLQPSLRSGTYVALALSTDGGATFKSPGGGVSPVLLLPMVTPPLTGDRPTVAVGPGSGGYAGSIWVTYFTQGGIAVSGAGVSASGAIGAFASQLLPNQPPGQNYGDITVGPNGEVAVSYGPNSGGQGGTLYAQISANPLGGVPFGPPIAVAASNVGGFTYIPAQPNWGIDAEPRLVYDRSPGPHRGRLYFSYVTATSPGGADTDIYLLSSDDQGASWSTPVRVDDDATTTSQFLPHLTLDQTSGAVALTWQDARNSPTNTQTQFWGAISTDGGASFTPNFQISTGTSDQARSIAALKKADYGDYSGNAFDHGLLIPAWADNSNSTGDNPDGTTNFDVYTAAIRVPANTPPQAGLSFPAPGATGWFTTGPVTGTVAVTSGDSTISRIDCTGAAVGSITGLGSASASAPVTVSALGITPVSCTATDAQGLTSQAATASIQLDSVAPGLAPSLSPPSLTPLLNASVTALPNATDNISGLASASCNTVNTAALGPQSVGCTAIDNAGDSSSATLNYVVNAGMIHITTPTRQLEPGAAIRVALQLADANGAVISDAMAASLGATAGSCGVSATLFDAAPHCLAYHRSVHAFVGSLSVPAGQPGGTYKVQLTGWLGATPVATGQGFVRVKTHK